MRLTLAVFITLTLYAVIVMFKTPLKYACEKTIGKVIDRIFDPWMSFRRRQHQKRLDRRIAAGSDRYFEELRTLQAYDPDVVLIQPPQSLRQKVASNIIIFVFITFHIYKIIPENI